MRYVTAFLFRAVFTEAGSSIFAHSSPLVAQKEVLMRPLVNVKHRDERYFPPHPLQGAFALIASMALGGLVMIALVLALIR